MAGCSIVFILLIILPIFLVLAFLLFGLFIGAIFALVFSIILYILFTKKGIFDKYLNSDVKWERITARVIKVALILIMICSAIGILFSLGITTWYRLQIG